MPQTFPEGIADFQDGAPAGDPWVGGPSAPEPIEIVPFSPLWADRFVALAERIRGALGDSALGIEHVGSTAVPGLAAKEVIDIDLTVADPAAEADYVPALEALGYVLRVREPEFEEHRMLRLAEPRVNLHVFGPGSAEAARHRLFRDWLHAHPAEREAYAEAKRLAAAEGPDRVMAYNARKAIVVREIFARAFAGAGIPLAQRALAPASLPELPVSLGETPLHWRPASRTALPGLLALAQACGEIDHPRSVVTAEELALGLVGERFDPARDSVMALDGAGRVLAAGSARLADTAGAEIEVALDGMVHPEIRRRGVGRALLAWQLARGRQLLAASGETAPGILALSGRAEHPGLAELARAAGLAPVRWWQELARPLAGELPERETPEGVRFVPFSARLSERTRAAVNDAFRDHWGFHPITRKEWEREGALAEFAPELSRLAVTGRGGIRDPRRVVGLVLSERRTAEFALRGGAFGTLSTVGVVRDWRGRGLSSALIAEVLRAYREAGLASAVLDVDSANPSGAHVMYARLGFAEQDRSVTYAQYC